MTNDLRQEIQMRPITQGESVTINGKAMWTVESEMVNGDVKIYRYIDGKNKRYLISRSISPLKLKKWGE